MWTEVVEGQFVTTNLNTLLTALHVKIDDLLGHRTRPGRPPKLSDAELLTLAVAQVGSGLLKPARVEVAEQLILSARPHRAARSPAPLPPLGQMRPLGAERGVAAVPRVDPRVVAVHVEELRDDAV
jgi:hypothetical protein